MKSNSNLFRTEVTFSNGNDVQFSGIQWFQTIFGVPVPAAWAFGPMVARPARFWAVLSRASGRVVTRPTRLGAALSLHEYVCVERKTRTCWSPAAREHTIFLFFFSDEISQIGDIVVVKCVNMQDQPLIIVTLYISPNKTLSNIIKFIHQQLLHFTIDGSALLNSNYHELPMILAGDFNVNFRSEESQPLIDFLKEKLNLTMNTCPLNSTTRFGTTIDAVFSRNLANLQSKVYVSHFSYHKPLLSYFNYDNN